MKRHLSSPSFAKQQGVTLVELVIAASLTLVLIVGISGVFIASQATYRTAEGLSRVQENIRTAFYLLDQDLRMAGNDICAPNTGAWRATWGVRGADSDAASNLSVSGGINVVATAPGLRVSGILSGVMAGVTFPGKNQSGIYGWARKSSTFSGTVPVLVCNYRVNSARLTTWDQIAVDDYQITIADGGTFDRNSEINRVFQATWYVGCNGRYACDDPAGRSLYRQYTDDAAVTTVELVEGIDNLTITYLRDTQDAFVAAAAITSDVQWATVVAARITIDFVEPDNESSGVSDTGAATAIRRTVSKVITFRSRT